MLGRKCLCLLVMILSFHCTIARQYQQAIVPDSVKLADIDSIFIHSHIRTSDAPLFYGTHGSSIEFGFKKETDPEISTALYDNVNDFVGFGMTYKILDADLSFSLPKTRLLEEERENLEPFRFS